eukprot:CAMPEP_0174723536 /NCGR_PEP_ID=MMETSP1094-20130205/41217_1 /TAXON_ID=156173 /ORGANISM="Chrysochromulina brevifilum, Strain UTEX LB 985" /LENGTH=41 /DNA_ID= /DNA_START= /DNA_END= /DNA_ORIENTATION=
MTPNASQTNANASLTLSSTSIGRGRHVSSTQLKPTANHNPQ